MGRKEKEEIRFAVTRTRELLERNADHIETFYHVLNRVDVRALRVLLRLAEKNLSPAKAST